MITAKEALEKANGQSKEKKEAALKWVEDMIIREAESEHTFVDFSFNSLKPYAGLVVETLTLAGFSVRQTATGFRVSWSDNKVSTKTSKDTKTTKPAVEGSKSAGSPDPTKCTADGLGFCDYCDCSGEAEDPDLDEDLDEDEDI